jgi:maleamate amidohydrolase
MSDEAYEAFDAGLDPTPGVGQRPALLIIDVVTAFLGEEGLSLAASLADRPLSCGQAGWLALPRVQALLEWARDRGFPVIYTVGDSDILGGALKKAVDDRQASRSEMAEIPDAITPLPGEAVIPKARASAFFGTPLTALLIKQKVDSLIVVGCTTSGCVRATVVDGHSLGWPVVVAEDASFDRAKLSHDVSLFEMNAKYAQVVTVKDIIAAYAASSDSDSPITSKTERPPLDKSQNLATGL